MRKIILSAILASSCLVLNAQGEKSDTLKPKKYYKYLGIQVNLLLQQFISFNSNSSINTNPYIFSYAKNNIQTGAGFAFGTGFNVSENSSNDGVSAIDVENVNISFRMGYEKKYLQQQKLIPFWGVDIGMGVVYNKTSSRLNQSFNTGTTTTETSKYFIGPSFRSGLLLSLSKHILLGTEFFFNVQAGITSTGINNGLPINTVAPFNIGFQVPTALFLIYKY